MLWLIPTDQALLIPDKAHPLANVVEVEGEKPVRDAGGIYFLDVRERAATQLEVDFPGLAPDGAPGASNTASPVYSCTTPATSLAFSDRS